MRVNEHASYTQGGWLFCLLVSIVSPGLNTGFFEDTFHRNQVEIVERPYMAAIIIVIVLSI